MPHVLDLPSAVKDLLYSQAVPEIKTKIVMTFRGKAQIGATTTGAPILESGYRLIELDISERFSGNEPIRIVTKKPELPSGKGNVSRGSNVRIAIINTDKVFSVAQDGAMIDPESVRNIRIKIYAKVGPSAEFQVYEGRVIGNPEEVQGKTIFTIRDAISDIVESPVRFENLSTLQSTYVDEFGNLQSTNYETGGTYKVRYYDAYTYLNYRGLPTPSVKISGSSVYLKNIDFTSAQITSRAADISTYAIEFVSDTGYIFRAPNQPEVAGSINSDLKTDYCQILASYWQVNGDPTGTKVEIQVYYTVSGNPISIIKRLIEHAFLNTWGNATTEPATLPVDWDTLNYLETVFDGFTIFLSETNPDPSVYSFTSSDDPISAKKLIDYISDHIGCYLITDSQGRVSMTNHFQSKTEVIHKINSDMVYSHKFIGNQKLYDVVGVKYGQSEKSFHSEILFAKDSISDYDAANSYDPGQIVRYSGVYYQAINHNPIGSFVSSNFERFNATVYNFPLRYYKTGVSYRLLTNYESKIIQKIFDSHNKVSVEILPAFGLPMMAGDKVELDFSEGPVKNLYAEAVRVSGQVGEKAVATFHQITPQLLELYNSGNYDEGSYN